MDRLITTKEAARPLGLAPRTLDRHRYAGNGPTYYRIGSRAVRYRVSDLMAWLADQRVADRPRRPRRRRKATPGA